MSLSVLAHHCCLSRLGIRYALTRESSLSFNLYSNNCNEIIKHLLKFRNIYLFNFFYRGRIIVINSFNKVTNINDSFRLYAFMTHKAMLQGHNTDTRHQFWIVVLQTKTEHLVVAWIEL